jgi:hypothetical protein
MASSKITEDWMPAAVRAVAFERKFKAGEALFRLRDKTAGFFEVISGRVRLVRVDRFGRETVLWLVLPKRYGPLCFCQYHCDGNSTDATCVYIRSAKSYLRLKKTQKL